MQPTRPHDHQDPPNHGSPNHLLKKGRPGPTVRASSTFSEAESTLALVAPSLDPCQKGMYIWPAWVQGTDTTADAPAWTVCVGPVGVHVLGEV